MDGNKNYNEAAKTCPKPVWLSAFFDGTGNNFEKDGKENTDPIKTKYSNVATLWAFAHTDFKHGERFAKEYIEGVGTPCKKAEDSGEGLDSALGMASAWKGLARIEWMLNRFEAHVNLHMPYVSQINLAVFGFSRGATQARAFVRMLADKLAYQQGDELVWRKSNVQHQHPKIVVYFVGLFDTVASIGFGGSRLESAISYNASQIGKTLSPATIFIDWASNGALWKLDQGGHAEWAHDLRIPSYVKQCIHFVATHEVREKFPLDSVRTGSRLPSNCLEVFYPGVHSDVGGGYEPISQENRSNELARIALNNMFIEAWVAGVPLKPVEEVLANAGPLFEISQDLEQCWTAYMGQNTIDAPGITPPADRLESQVIWHMNRYYQWRASRRRRLRDGRLRPQGGIDPYMKITDAEWEADLVNVAQSRSGWIRQSVYAHQQAMHDAFTGQWVGTLPTTVRASFDRFFDHYLHDSIAGFKKQLRDSSPALSIADMSRWSRNRQCFLGKDGKGFIYWRYEGWTPEYSPARIAALDILPPEQDSLPSSGMGTRAA